jgi:hypothetical protein
VRIGSALTVGDWSAQYVYEALGSFNLMEHPRQLRTFEMRENGQLDIASNELMIGRVEPAPGAAGVQPERRRREQPRRGQLRCD